MGTNCTHPSTALAQALVVEHRGQRLNCPNYMNNEQRLQLIIETALKHGWSWEQKHWPGGVPQEEVTEVILYGDNLSLLKAAVGNDIRKYDDGFDDYFWQRASEWVAQRSVLLPDSERLSFIVEHLRKG